MDGAVAFGMFCAAGMAASEFSSRPAGRILLILKARRPIRAAGRKTSVNTTLPAVEVVAGDQHKVLHLRGRLGTANGSVLRDAALKMALGPTGADSSRRIHVDMSELEGADVGAVQILVAFQAEAARRGRRFKLIGLREQVQQEWAAAGWDGFKGNVE
jgi:anti-anti-sigma regulatory factor